MTFAQDLPAWILPAWVVSAEMQGAFVAGQFRFSKGLSLIQAVPGYCCPSVISVDLGPHLKTFVDSGTLGAPHSSLPGAKSPWGEGLQ